MSQESHWEDQMVNAAVEALERGTDPSAAVPRVDAGAETAETLARLYTEVLGLIPYELAPAVPHPEAKQRLLGAIIGIPAAAAPRPAAAPVPAPAPAPPAAAQAPAEPEPPAELPSPEQPMPGVRRLPPRPVPLSAARRPLGWPALLAAAVITALLGLPGWLYLQQADQRETIARLQHALEGSRQKEVQATQQAELFKSEFTRMKTTMTLVTAPAALVTPLRPAGPLHADARGALFVAADHQHWHLSIEGLKPSPPGKVYQLWFMPAQGPPVNGGTFLAKAGERVEMSSEAMPADTRSAKVTLEDAGGSQAPSPSEVLRGGEVFRVL